MRELSEAELGPGVHLTIGEAGIATVTLDRPPVNALHTQTMFGVARAFETAGQAPEVSVIVLRAAGRVFSAGIDLKEKHGGQDPHAAGLAMLNAVVDAPVPVLCAVNGPALGGGAALAMYCDMVIAAPEATFAMTDIDVGMIGGSAMLLRHLPGNIVRKMIFTAERLPAARGHELGFVNEICPADALWSRAGELAAEIAGKNRTALTEMKRLVVMGEYLHWRNLYGFESAAAARYAHGEEASRLTADFLATRHRPA